MSKSLSRTDRLAVPRDALSLAIEECESKRDLPPLIREYRAVMAEIESLTPSAKVGDPIDEVAARRAARGGATSRLGDTAGSAR